MFNIGLGREVIRIAPNIDSILGLVHADPVDAHHGGEGEVIPVDRSKVSRYPEVGYEVL